MDKLSVASLFHLPFFPFLHFILYDSDNIPHIQWIFFFLILISHSFKYFVHFSYCFKCNHKDRTSEPQYMQLKLNDSLCFRTYFAILSVLITIWFKQQRVVIDKNVCSFMPSYCFFSHFCIHKNQWSETTSHNVKRTPEVTLHKSTE